MMLNRFYASTIVTLAAVNESLAQATPPATPGSPAAPATTNGGASWLWIIIGLAIIAGLVWYFMRGRSRTTTTGTSANSGTTTGRTNVYDNDRRK
jgi:bacteriorhodopsin